MKKRIMQCMAVAVAAIALFSCEQDRPAYSGKNYLMFSDTYLLLSRTREQ